MDIQTYEPQKIASITIRNNINLLPLNCNYLQAMVSHIGMSEEKTKTIRLLTENVLKRRIINAYPGIGEITMDILVGLDRLIVEISDQGVPYWVDIKKELESLPRKADVYQLKKLGTEGQCFSMCFYLEPEIDVMAFKKQDGIEESLLDSNLQIRPVQPVEEEIIEIIKCIHSNYGYGYINHRIYDLEQMKAILAEGNQWSYIGINDHKQIMAHASLAFHDDFKQMPELGGLVSKPYCRGHNVAGRMVEALCEAGKRKGVNGIFAMPVAFHPMSQKILNKQGFVPTGVLLHYVTPESTGEYADGDRRLDVCICAKLFKTAAPLKISVPMEHQPFVKDLYRKLGTACEFLPEMPPAGAGNFRIRYEKEISVGQLFVENAPADFDKDLDAMLGDFSRNNIAMAEAYVNISVPSAETVYRLLRDRGFFFSGILPGSSNGQYMILQNLMGHPVEWEKIVVIEGYDALLQYVKDHVKTQSLPG